MTFAARSRMIAFAVTLVVIAASIYRPAQAAAPATAEAERLHALFDEEWAWTLREFPEFATVVDNRYNDKLTDLSVQAMERRKAHERDIAKRIAKIDRNRLSGQDVVSYDLFRYESLRNVALQAFPAGRIPEFGLSPLEWAPVTRNHGVHRGISTMALNVTFRAAKDYRDFLARLAVVPEQIDQVSGLMRRDIAAGWTAPAVAMGQVPAQIDAQLVDDPVKSPLYKPFQNFPEGIAEDDRAQLAAQGREEIKDIVFPALKRLRRFMAETYIPAARQDIGAASLPDGSAFYAQMVRYYTTTDLSPQEIHEIGEREVARVHNEIDAIIKQVGFAGDYAAFLKSVRGDPRFYFATGDEILRAYRDIAKRVDPELPKLFAQLPRLPYGIRAIPTELGEAVEYYVPGTAQGARAGYFNAYIANPAARPKFAMEDLFLHEGVPGHHLQVSRAQEIEGLPQFRRHAIYGAYTEGWALYAESLGESLGLYKDPYAKFGQLNAESWRASRLVVDTGIHAFGWSRQQAIDYLKGNTGLAESFIESEVDRYIVWPGQALSYKIGELKIKGLRANAQRALGAKFDIRRFHNALLDDGALPLDLLEKRIDEWIRRQR